MDGVERVLSREGVERKWGGVGCDRWDRVVVSTTAPKVVFSSIDIFTVIESADDSIEVCWRGVREAEQGIGRWWRKGLREA